MPSDQPKVEPDPAPVICPRGTDVGPLGRAQRSIDNFVSGFIYAAAIEGLVEQTIEIDRALETMSKEDLAKHFPDLEEEVADLDAKWILATAMFSIDA